MKRRRSPRQRRDTVRRRRWQQRDEARRDEARAAIEGTRPVTAADLLAREHQADAVPVLLRRGHGVAVIGAGWRVVGSLAAVQAELERRRAG